MTTNSTAARFKSYVDSYERSMRNVIRGQAVFDTNMLYQEDEKFFKLVTNGFLNEEKKDLGVLLEERLRRMVEQEVDRTSPCPGKKLDGAHLCIYLTDEWVYVVGYTKSMGNVNIDFGKASEDRKSGLAAQIIHGNGNIAWDKYGKLTDADEKQAKVENFIDVIASANYGNITTKKLIGELFKRVKESAEKRMKETVSQVMLVTSYHFNYLGYRRVLRDCCQYAGFKQVSVKSSSSLSVNNIFSNLLRIGFNVQAVFVLVVEIDYVYTRLYIYSCDMLDSKINQVQPVAAAYCYIVSKEVIAAAYQRAMAQIPVERRNSIRYYVVFKENNYSDKEKIVDEVFRDCEKLIKSESISGDNLKNVFSQVTSNYCNESNALNAWKSFPKKLSADIVLPTAYIEVPTNSQCENIDVPSASIVSLGVKPPVEDVAREKTPTIIATASTTVTPMVALGLAKLPLKIHTVDGKTVKIVAITDWTVKRLKKEFLECCSGQIDKGLLVLVYRSTVLADDDSLLSSYKIHADSVIEAGCGEVCRAQAVEVPTVHPQSQSIPQKCEVPIQLIGNCIASKNGTTAMDVKGIKRGSLVCSRLDLEHLSMGEVALICKINGFGDTVYIGVKFRKQLALGSYEIVIDHADVTQGYCDKCKGRRSLFIPQQYIGKSNDNMFQVE